ncbi:hypothetical protein AMAG_13522 [Allomyces macrogynus ATCC 38327]|uniref:Uncharacterized protein n=1 Tax=Allomyces macrogynus (strain ATCC 38327) TaxID=578462 RepID=A0A0L0T2K3_ALLM3|nr:hypothetical protein AMAG_13522 [Allomyces macrogynus ATCC 38327]|eukprot:KNE68885.1 hypothetical protein AMAG_13522 [Allomyces macrogynus ATCC 38327]
MARHAPAFAMTAAVPPPATTTTPTSPTFSTLADPLHPHESLLDRRRRRLDERAHLQQQHHHVPPPPPPLALATSPPHVAPLLLAGAPTLAPPTTATTPTSATHHLRRRSRGSMMLLFSPTKPRASGLGNADTSDSDSDDAVRARLRSVISAPVAVAASSNPSAVPLGPTVHAPAPRSPVAAGVLARQRTLQDESSDSDETDDAAARLRALARVGITVTPPPGNGIPGPPPPTPAMLSPATQKKRKSPGVFRMLARTLADGFSSATRSSSSSSSSTRGGTLPRSGPPDPSTPSSFRGSFDLAEEPRRVSISSPHLVAATARTVLAGVVPLAEAALRQQTTGFASLPRSTPPPPPGAPQRPRAAHPPPSPALRRRSMSFSDLPRLDAPHSMTRAASPARNAAHAVSAASPLVHVVEVDGEEDTAPLPPRPPSRTSARTVPTGPRLRTPSGPHAAPPPPMPPPAGAVPPVPPMSPTTTATAHVTAVAIPAPAPPPSTRSRSPAASRSRASTMPDDDAALDAAWLPPAHVTKRISLTPKLIADSDPGVDGGDAWRLPSWIGSDLDALAAGVGGNTGGSSKRSLSRSRSSVVSAARSSLPPAAADVPTVAADGDTDAPPPTSPAAAPPSADDVSRLESLMARTVDEERAMLASFISSSTPAMTGGAPPTPPPEPVPKDLPPPPRRAASPSPPRSATSPSAGTKPRTLRDLLSAVAADVPGTLKRARSAGKANKRSSKEAGPVLAPSSPKPAQEATMELIAAYAGLCDDESPVAETAPAVEPETVMEKKGREGGEEVDPEVAHLVAQIHRAMRDLDEESPARSTVESPRTPVAAGP